MLVFKMSLKLLPLPLRVAMLLIFLQTLGHSWMVENPSSSCLLLHPWLQWAINLIQKFGGSDTWMNSCYFTICEPCTKCYLCLPTTPKHLQCVVLAEVYRIRFWMRHYGSASMKPTQLIVNQAVLGGLDLGPVPQRRKKGSRRTTKRYLDSRGKRRYVGTKALKASQNLSPIDQLVVFIFFYDHDFGGHQSQSKLGFVFVRPNSSSGYTQLPSHLQLSNASRRWSKRPQSYKWKFLWLIDIKYLRMAYYAFDSFGIFGEWNTWKSNHSFGTRTLFLCHRCAEVDTSTPLVELFAAAPATTCDGAEFGEVITYLKRSKYLDLPLEWHSHFRAM